jgi:hypothetical protein
MNNTILISVIGAVLVTACGSKLNGSYSVDVEATKASPEFVAKNNQTKGGASMGLQVFSQIAKSIIIKDSKFRLVTLDCEIDAGLTKAECVDQNDLKAPKKVLGFASSGDTIKIDAGDGYSLIYSKLKN